MSTRTVDLSGVYDEEQALRDAEEAASDERREAELEAARMLQESGADAATAPLGEYAGPEEGRALRMTTPQPGDPPVRSAEEMRRIREQPPEPGQWPFQGQSPQPLDTVSPAEMARRSRVEGESRAAAMRAQQRPASWFAGGEDDATLPRMAPVAAQQQAEGSAATPRQETPQGPAKMSGDQFAAGAPGRLDEGLPSEGDVQREQALDVPRRILRALAAGLRGRSSDAPYRGDVLAQQRQQGIATRMQAKAGERQREIGADEQMRRQRAIDARQAQSIEAQSQRDAMAAEQRAADRSVRERQIGVGERRLQLTEAEQQRQQAERDALADPQSEQSRAARVALLTRLRSVTDPALRQEYAAAGLTPEAIAGMSARDIEPLLEGGGQLARPATMRDARRRGEGTSGPRTGIGGAPVDMEALVERYVALGGDEATARAMRPRDLVSELNQRTRPRGRAGGFTAADGVALLPGVYADPELVERGEGRSFRRDFTSARTQYASLGQIDRIAQRYGASGVISPEVAGELGGPLSRLRAMVAQLQNTGVINPSEAPAIEAMLPDPRSLSQMTFGTLQGRLASFRRELEAAVESELVARGVGDDGIDTALGYLRGGRVSAERAAGGGRSEASAGSAAEPQAEGGTVRVRRVSDGSVREVPRAAWERASEAQRAQYEEVP